jgi:hypothetical protein
MRFAVSISGKSGIITEASPRRLALQNSVAGIAMPSAPSVASGEPDIDYSNFVYRGR